MLVLSRKKSEMIQIGDAIVIRVIHIGRHTAKIGIEAPKNVRVLRVELCDGAPPLSDFLKGRRASRKAPEPAPAVANPQPDPAGG